VHYKHFRLGVVAAFLLGACAACIAGAGVLVLGSRGFTTREAPSAVERWLAVRVRSAAIPEAARRRENPIVDSVEVLAGARAHWADHCAACHANDGSGDSPMGKNTYPPAPDMRLAATQQKTDGELFFVIENGVRFSAMPAWGSGSSHDEEESWKLVRFIRHLPNLTAEEKKQMERLNPKSPDEIREEQEEEEFLKGKEIHEPKLQHHH
jgi:mono/diheme cytochrome c family protein